MTMPSGIASISGPNPPRNDVVATAKGCFLPCPLINDESPRNRQIGHGQASTEIQACPARYKSGSNRGGEIIDCDASDRRRGEVLLNPRADLGGRAAAG